MAETPNCPECDELMVRRVNRLERTFFWGCTSYPDCTGTRPYVESSISDEESVPQKDLLPSERQRSTDKSRWRR